MGKIQSVVHHYMLDLLLIFDTHDDDHDTTENYQIIDDITFIEPDNTLHL